MTQRAPGSEPLSSDEIDDQFRSLMEGLRTTIPGVMVLFSFLLVVPFQVSFAEIGTGNTAVFYIAFVSSAVASVFLIAPSVHQRVRAPISGIRRRTMSHVMVATRLANAGTSVFLVAVGAVIYLVSSLVFNHWLASVVTAVTSGVAAWAWFYLPLVSFSRDQEKG